MLREHTTFSGLANGSYTVTPSLTGFTFSPTSAAVTVNGANVTVPNFTATAQTWTITGSVGTTGSGATINLTGASTATTTANASGAYTFSGLANGSYTVTPTLAGYTFSPTSQAVTVSGANVTVPNFTATAQTWRSRAAWERREWRDDQANRGIDGDDDSEYFGRLHLFRSGEWIVYGHPDPDRLYVQSHKPGRDGQRRDYDGAELHGDGADLDDHGRRGTSGSGATIALTGASTATTTATTSGAYYLLGSEERIVHHDTSLLPAPPSALRVQP